MPEINIAEELQKIAEAKAAIAAEVAAQDQAEAALRDRVDAAKAVCFATCGQVNDALQASADPFEQNALIELEATTHADHAAELEAAYRALSGQREGESNPAGPGTTQLTADITASADLPS